MKLRPDKRCQGEKVKVDLQSKQRGPAGGWRSSWWLVKVEWTLCHVCPCDYSKLQKQSKNRFGLALFLGGTGEARAPRRQHVWTRFCSGMYEWGDFTTAHFVSLNKSVAGERHLLSRDSRKVRGGQRPVLRGWDKAWEEMEDECQRWRLLKGRVRSVCLCVWAWVRAMGLSICHYPPAELITRWRTAD